MFLRAGGRIHAEPIADAEVFRCPAATEGHERFGVPGRRNRRESLAYGRARAAPSCQARSERPTACSHLDIRVLAGTSHSCAWLRPPSCGLRRPVWRQNKADQGGRRQPPRFRFEGTPRWRPTWRETSMPRNPRLRDTDAVALAYAELLEPAGGVSQRSRSLQRSGVRSESPTSSCHHAAVPVPQSRPSTVATQSQAASPTLTIPLP